MFKRLKDLNIYRPDKNQKIKMPNSGLPCYNLPPPTTPYQLELESIVNQLKIADKIGKDNAMGILRSVSVQLDQLLTKLEKE